jgi:hypothetical protein
MPTTLSFRKTEEGWINEIRPRVLRAIFSDERSDTANAVIGGAVEAGINL